MIHGYEFNIREGKTKRWVRIMGSGGLLGDGTLCSVNLRTDGDQVVMLAKVMPKLLRQARLDLDRNGDIKVLRSWDLPPHERFENIKPDEILDIREIRS